jgi:alpha-L-fucosidase
MVASGMKKVFSQVSILLLFCTMISCQTQDTQKAGSYQASWESLTKHETPVWFRDAKFGIYFHWGPYSVPAYKTEWYSHYMYDKNHPIHQYHVEKYGPLDQFGYKDFIPMFTAENFNADEWVSIFQKAGAQFVGPVTEHADGFAMWDSKLTKWDAMDMGPRRDIVGEMEKAVRKTDMKFITTFHHQWLWSWYATWDKTTDASNPEFEDLYGPNLDSSEFVGSEENPTFMANEAFAERWITRLREVIDKYNPDLIYFDNKMNILDEKYRLDFLQYYYNHAESRNQNVVVTYKAKDLQAGAGVLDLERARMSDKKDFPWLTDDSIDWSSWCNVENPDYKSANRIIDFLADVVSKNGGLLLNVTPTADGSIPQPVVDRLLEIGAWFDINGEAIYGSRPFEIYGEGPQEIVEGHLSERQNKDATAEDIRFTTNGEALFAIALDWPKDQLVIHSLGSNSAYLVDGIERIELLGSAEEISFERQANALIIDLPGEAPGRHAFAFKIVAF